MQVVEKRQVNAFVFISAAQQDHFGSDERLTGDGPVKKPLLWAWFRIPPVSVPEMPYVSGPTGPLWNDLQPTVSELVEEASYDDAEQLGKRVLFKNIGWYLGFDFRVTYQDLFLCKTCCVAQCGPMISPQTHSTAQPGLLIPVSQESLLEISEALIDRHRVFEQRKRLSLDMTPPISSREAALFLRFSIELNLCQFVLLAMDEFSKKLIEHRRAQLKRMSERKICAAA